jgi:SNF family Na+-dependent transporter
MFDCLGFLLPFYSLPFATIICTIAILLIEGKSVLEHSAKKKSASANIPEIFRMIIKASTTKDAEAIINYLKNKHNGELDSTE